MNLIFLLILTSYVIYKFLETLGKKPNKLKEFKNIYSILQTSKEQLAIIKKINFKEKNLKPDSQKVLDQLIKEEDFAIDIFKDSVIENFRVILEAFTNNRKDVLKKFLDKNVYQKFLMAIETRIRNDLTYTNTLVSIKNTCILNANIKNKIVSITLEIKSEQIIITKNKNDEIILGSNNIISVHDIWMFQKPIQSKNIWKLTSTDSR